MTSETQWGLEVDHREKPSRDLIPEGPVMGNHVSSTWLEGAPLRSGASASDPNAPDADTEGYFLGGRVSLTLRV